MMRLKTLGFMGLLVGLPAAGCYGITPSGDIDEEPALDLGEAILPLGPAIGASRAGDDFSQALAAGDFDGDGHDDLAVGAPGDGWPRRSGLVYLFKGTGSGLVPWRVLSQDTRPVDRAGNLGAPLDSNEGSDQFGATLAVGDFDGDSRDDLAVGAPGDGAGNESATAGAVYLFHGFPRRTGDARFGLQPWQVVTQAKTGFGASEAGDAFGFSLAVGDFNHDSKDDLAIGAPGETPPGMAKCGIVFVARGTSTGLAEMNTLMEHPFLYPKAGDQFGYALAAGDFDGDADDDLAIGIPGRDLDDDEDVGEVHLYRSVDGSLNNFWSIVEPSALGPRLPLARFGEALAEGPLNHRASHDLAVEAPNTWSGVVYLFKGRTNNFPAPWQLLTQDTGNAEVAERSDRFGANLTIAQVQGDASAELMVGVPGEGLAGLARVGTAHIYQRDGNVMEYLATPGGFGLVNTRDFGTFGASMAVGDFDAAHGNDLVIGSPDHTIWFEGSHYEKAGAAVLYDLQEGAPFGLWTTARQLLSQEMTGTLEP
jgi:hypothetical protein